MVHCEKLMFLLWFATFGVIYLAYMHFIAGGITLNMNLVYLILGAFGFGALGSLYYRIEKHKKPYWAIWGKL